MINIVRISDGLGNQMFQYAFARKLQLMSRNKVYLDTRFINHKDILKRDVKDHFHEKCDYRKYGLHNFKIILPEANESILKKWGFLEKQNDFQKLICNLSQRHLWIRWYNDENQKEQQDLFDLTDCRWPVYFQGYFFNIQYFDDIRHILQKEFCAKVKIEIPFKLYQILKIDNTIGIHVRKGDFTKLSRDISQTEYYLKAMRSLEERVKNPTYLIFSDDIGWVKENIEIHGKKVYISKMGFSDYEELMIMKHCKYFIIANSTFSYWAAYLNNNPEKIVICPKRWKQDIIPKEWIRI